MTDRTLLLTITVVAILNLAAVIILLILNT
jgi:hypothetical protein